MKLQQTNRLNLSLNGDRWGLGAVLDLSYDQRTEEFNRNYFLELNGKYKTDEWEIMAGNILKACGRGNAIEGPHIWPLIGFPKTIPYYCYATGAKLTLKKELSDGNLLVSVDITGRGDVPFYSSHRFDRLESSGLITYEMSSGSLGAVYESTEKRFSAGIFGEWRPNRKLFIRCEVDGTKNYNKESSNIIGGFIDVTFRPLRPFSISAIGIFNEQFSKYWEETTLVKDKKGYYKTKTETKYSPDDTETGVGLYASWFATKDDSLIWKAGGYQRLDEDALGKNFPIQYSWEIIYRF
jgi:hypothetical protein